VVIAISYLLSLFWETNLQEISSFLLIQRTNGKNVEHSALSFTIKESKRL